MAFVFHLLCSAVLRTMSISGVHRILPRGSDCSAAAYVRGREAVDYCVAITSGLSLVQRQPSEGAIVHTPTHLCAFGLLLFRKQIDNLAVGRACTHTTYNIQPPGRNTLHAGSKEYLLAVI